MKFLLTEPFGAFDLETTAVDVETARIVTSCVALLQPAEPTWRQLITSRLVAVDIDIPAEATAIHGITTEFAQVNGTRPQVAINDIVVQLTDMLAAKFPIVGMNLAYDLTVIDREARRYGLNTLGELINGISAIVDVYVIDKWLDPFRPGGRKLTDLIRFYGVRHEGAHDSTGDALAAARVAYRMAQVAQSAHHQVTQFFAGHGRKRPEEIADRFAMLGLMNATALHENQVRWRAEQQASLREYLIRKGEKDPDCDPHWPVRPFNQGEEMNPWPVTTLPRSAP